jgi:hypothetical protein
MNFVLYLVLLLQTTIVPKAYYGHHGPALLPDPHYTPGIVRTTDASLVCHSTTKAIRQPGIQTVYALYGVEKQKGICCEIDHLISLELGGDNGLKNEWPQPYEPRPGAHEKDIVENYLHAQVCSGKMSLADAQKQIATDWFVVYLKMKGQK